ncbi:hypothetical protein MB46_03550 [Arthrobacter alpinus]|uniref:hypothetical protein n=1 Tax=Arthrobacter alpinus TaxID=656366 RepID=UPI00067883A6|nr:hypothetical protein [Arthrobacter alpinus]ALV44724.1 hypothetical protein MB46_03550 [Arthrobacter alpinus]
MTAAQHTGAPPLTRRGPSSSAIRSEHRVEASSQRSQAGTQLSSLYTSLALLGIAALAGAATSSLIPGLGGETVGSGDPLRTGTNASAIWEWAAGGTSAVYCLAALAYGFVSFRKGTLPRVSALRLVVALAAGVHLIGLLEGLWRTPESGRTFDGTLASLLILELSVIAVLGWVRNVELRSLPSKKARREPSAMAVVGSLFAASVLVAAITTAGMAASTAGDLAVPHSGHSETGTENGPNVPSNIEQLKNQGHHH